jgi:hypothetical protein
MSDKKAPKTNKKIMDVAHPGKTAPATSGRPVIVTNRPILKDPMVREDEPEETKPVSREAEVKPSSPEKTIAQLAEEAKARADKVEDEKSAVEAKEKASVQEPEPEPKPSQEPTEKPAPKEDEPAASSDTVTPGAEAAATEDTRLAEENKKDAELEKLVESREYFVSINAVEKRRTKRIIVLGVLLSVLLALAWVDIALDAGLIQIDNVKPVTHFFSN